MDGQNETILGVDAAKKSRQRSTIAFPYMDMESAIKMADAIHGNVGHGECSDDQLAAWTGQSGKSSTFRVQVYASRTFGILGGEASRHCLTELGRKIIDPNQARPARIEAFLNVQLYAAVFDKYKGGTLPPPAALEREMVSLGVSDKQKDRARQVFERSAEQAGFFEHGRNRLVQPGVNSSSAVSSSVQTGSSIVAAAPTSSPNANFGGGGGGNLTGDLLIDALISKLPQPGTIWSADERVTWLSLISMAFQMTYGVEPNIEIKKV